MFQKLKEKTNFRQGNRKTKKKERNGEDKQTYRNRERKERRKEKKTSDNTDKQTGHAQSLSSSLFHSFRDPSPAIVLFPSI